MHTRRETEVGISSLQPHSQHHTSQPRWWPSRNSSRQAGSSSMHGGYASSDGQCVTTQASNRCRQREAINTSAAQDWGKAQGNQCSPVVSYHSERTDPTITTRSRPRGHKPRSGSVGRRVRTPHRHTLPEPHLSYQVMVYFITSSSEVSIVAL